jgi:hypothetical protein
MLCEALGVQLEQLAAVDREGRALITDHGPFLLVNMYGACGAAARLAAIDGSRSGGQLEVVAFASGFGLRMSAACALQLSAVAMRWGAGGTVTGDQ